MVSCLKKCFAASYITAGRKGYGYVIRSKFVVKSMQVKACVVASSLTLQSHTTLTETHGSIQCGEMMHKWTWIDELGVVKRPDDTANNNDNISLVKTSPVGKSYWTIGANFKMKFQCFVLGTRTCYVHVMKSLAGKLRSTRRADGWNTHTNTQTHPPSFLKKQL